MDAHAVRTATRQRRPQCLGGSRIGQLVFGLPGALFLPLAIAAIISVIAPYVYNSPVHHCPFCLLKPQYGFIGYALYLPLFAASALSLSIAVLAARPAPASLRQELPARLRRMSLVATGLFAAFALMCLYAIATSRLILFH
jgi:hypothetical protein